jgi:hypothetical protein
MLAARFSTIKLTNPRGRRLRWGGSPLERASPVLARLGVFHEFI